MRANSFYREAYQSIFYALILAIMLLLLLVVLVLYQVFHRPKPSFFAMTPNGQTTALTSFDEPNYLPSTLIKWASKAAVAAYTYDFVNYNKQLTQARPYFTDTGWTAYQASIGSLLQTITQNQLFVNGVVSGPPVIANQGELPDVGYSWRIQIPFLVTYQGAEAVSRRALTVIMTIVKVPTEKDPTGMGIDQFVMR